MPHSHIVSSFDDELNNLRQKIIKMANLVETQFKEAELSLINNDLDLAKKVKITDDIVD